MEYLNIFVCGSLWGKFYLFIQIYTRASSVYAHMQNMHMHAQNYTRTHIHSRARTHTHSHIIASALAHVQDAHTVYF